MQDSSACPFTIFINITRDFFLVPDAKKHICPDNYLKIQ